MSDKNKKRPLPEKKTADKKNTFSGAGKVNKGKKNDEYTAGQTWDAAAYNPDEAKQNKVWIASRNAEMRRRRKENFAKDIIKCVVVLSVIALISGVVLGMLNWLTYVDPDSKIIEMVASQENVAAENVTKNIDRVVNDSSSKNKILGVYEIKTDGQITGFAYYASGAGGKGGNIELLVYLSTDGVINEITVYSQKETAGYFDRVNNSLKPKYVGIDISGIEIFILIDSGTTPSDGSEINNVTNASITSKGYNNAINAVVYAFNNYQG